MNIDLIPLCRLCGKTCNAVWVDKGIGPHEYAGAPGNDVRVCEVSDCCHAAVELVPDIQDEEDDDGLL